jgi:hypothetical protein
MATDQELAAFHRYFIWANRLRTEFDQILASGTRPTDLASTWFADGHGMFMSHWYAALYVVVEGWRELGFHDNEIDTLLSSSNVGHLRRYRNGVCHFQPTYLDARFVELMSSSGSVAWIRQLNSAFGRWFLEEYARRGHVASKTR